MSQTLVKYFLFNLLFLTLFVSQQANALPVIKIKDIPVKLVFETQVASPIAIVYCKKYLWTFSVANQKIINLDPQNGKIIKEFNLSSLGLTERPTDLAAMSCRENHLFIVINSKAQNFILETEYKQDSLEIVRKMIIPRKARTTDFFCDLKQCWLLQDKPLISTDLKKWTLVDIPEFQNLKKSLGHPELDPFEDWQSTLILAKGRYSKGAVNSIGETVLLDSTRSQAVTPITLLSGKSEWQKWGSYGAWEGSFLSPKSLAFVTDDILAVTDAKLKSVFLFKRNGLYLGVLAMNPTNIYSPTYPLDLTSDHNRLFVADFGANKITAVDILQLQSNVDLEKDLNIRKNLFRRDEVFKDPPSALCLNCHDGTVSNHLYKYVKMQFHHPLECSQCHEPHHNSKEVHFLRQSPQTLCQSCHKDYSEPKTNHVWPRLKPILNGKKINHGGQCTDCHQSHAETGKLLVKPMAQLCLDCHNDKKISHESVVAVSNLENSKNVHVEEGKISCKTCHQTHINWKETHFIKDPKPILNLCSSCHGEKSVKLFKDFHKSMKLKKSSP
jgi:predicted CXXCH cytochrome family protein